MANFAPNFGTLGATQKIEWFGTVRGRLGYFLHPDWMIYGTGGLAYGSVKESANLTLTSQITLIAFGVGGSSFACVNPSSFFPAWGGRTCFDGSRSRTSVGWSAGAGNEFRLTQVEYLYVNLGNEDFNIPAVTLLEPGNPSILRVSFDDAAFHVFRAGLNLLDKAKGPMAPALTLIGQTNFLQTGLVRRILLSDDVMPRSSPRGRRNLNLGVRRPRPSNDSQLKGRANANRVSCV